MSKTLTKHDIEVFYNETFLKSDDLYNALYDWYLHKTEGDLIEIKEKISEFEISLNKIKQIIEQE